MPEDWQSEEISNNSCHTKNSRSKLLNRSNNKNKMLSREAEKKNRTLLTNNSESNDVGGKLTSDNVLSEILVSEFPSQFCPLAVPLCLQPPSYYHCPKINSEIGATPLNVRLSALTTHLCKNDLPEIQRKDNLSQNIQDDKLLEQEEELELTLPLSPLQLSRLATSFDSKNELLQHQPTIADAREHYVVSIKNTTLMTVQDAETQAESAWRDGSINASARYWFLAGCVLFNARHYQEAIDVIHKAITLFVSVSDKVGLILCHNLIGVCYHRLHMFKMSLIHHRKQYALQSTFATLSIVAEINMALCYLALYDLVNAAALLRDAIEHLRCITEQWSNQTESIPNTITMLHTIAMGNVGWCKLFERNMYAAQEYFQLLLAECSNRGDKYSASYCLLLMSEVYNYCSDYRHALFFIQHALRLSQEISYNELVDIARVKLALTQSHLNTRDAVLHECSVIGNEHELRRIIPLLQ